MATSTHCVFIISNRAATGRDNLHFFDSDCNILFCFLHLCQSGGLFIKGLVFGFWGQGRRNLHRVQHEKSKSTRRRGALFGNCH